MNELTKEQIAFHDARRAEAPNIDPHTAEVEWWYGNTLDPYGIMDVPEQYSCVGREYFARRPGLDLWVHFGDLSEGQREVLWTKHKHKLAFPAGVEEVLNTR